MTTKITDKNISSIANTAVQWQTKVTSDGSTVTQLSAGEGYFIDNTSAEGIVKLPAVDDTNIGDTILIKDYAGKFATNKLTIQRNGHKIQGETNDIELSTNRTSVTLVFADSTRGFLFSSESNVNNFGPLFTSATGGTVTESGNFKIHTFTGDGCFVVSQIGNSSSVPTGGPALVDYLVVAGGGGSGGPSGDTQGGGGGGGFRFHANPSCNPQSGNPGSPLNAPSGITLTASTFPITVGAGGTGGSSGASGSNSIFSTITSAGGGFGANPGGPLSQQGKSGGSGGGGGGGGGLDNAGGAGNTPPVSPSQGNAGGNSSQSHPDHASGGGGGAIQAGFNGRGPTPGPANSGAGGAGAGITGFGSSNGECSSCKQYFSGGGGGGQATPVPLGGGAGGLGGGRPAGAPPGNDGLANTGGGGGGGRLSPSPGAGGAGGKGIVVIRYKFQ